MDNVVKIAVDTGASGIKVVCSVNGHEPYAFLIPPYVTEIDEPKKLIRDANFDKENLWLKSGKNYYAVGSLAKRYGAQQLIKPPKFTTATAKIFAAIGMAIQTLEIPLEFTLELSLLLPPAELGDAPIIMKNVKSSVKNLEFPSGKAKIELKGFLIYPEGYGFLNAQDLELKEYDSIVTIMMGYRNISMFDTNRGKPDRPYTELIGFHDYLFDISSETSIKIEDLIEPVCFRIDDDLKYYNRQIEVYNYQTEEIKAKILAQEKIASQFDPPDQELIISDSREKLAYCQKHLQKDTLKLTELADSYEKRFYHLINCDGKDRDYQDTKIKKVQADKRKKYVKRLKDWISERLPARPQLICIAGGTAKYLGDDIYSFLAEKGEVRKSIAIPIELDYDGEIYRRNVEVSTIEFKGMEPYKNQYKHYLCDEDKYMETQLERFEDVYGLFKIMK
ncbi:ParM/StbA family protein [Chamaesiphon sp.]|uniref:ParM/StbA family protein n=1 Tax=Chamaesiphon sp. TaxID=2814140 RepID=UPI00359416D5